MLFRSSVLLLPGELVNAKWWTDQGYACPNLPSDAILADVIRDIFCAPKLPESFAEGGGSRDGNDAPRIRDSRIGPEFMEGLSKCAPADSLAAR